MNLKNQSHLILKNPTNPKFNQLNEAIVRAAILADIENMPESVLEDAKIAEARRKTTKIYANIEHGKGVEEGLKIGKEENQKETVLKLYKKGKTAAEISDLLDIELNEVQQIILDFEQSQ